MKIEVKRYPGRWYAFPWTCRLSDDGRYAFGCGATRAGAIRHAFSNLAGEVIKPRRVPEPVHVEELGA